MASKSVNITALSPFISYTGPWQTNAGATVLGKINVVPPPSRSLKTGSGSIKINGFSERHYDAPDSLHMANGFASQTSLSPKRSDLQVNAIKIRGSQSGVGCSYTARIQSQRQNDNTPLPAAQTSPQDANLLVSFSDLPFAPYSLSMEANCNSARLELTQVEMNLWSGDSGQTVTEESVDDTSPLLGYSNNDWTPNNNLDAEFFNDTQHYTSIDGATVSLTLSGASIVIIYGSLDSYHGPFRVNTSGPSTSPTSDTYNGLNSFLAVPVPLFIASGLDPRNEHTITLEKTGAQYLDLDYVQTYKVAGGSGPPGGELNAQSSNNSLALLIGKIVGPILGVVILVALVVFFVRRRRRTKVRESWVPGVEKPQRSLFGRKANNSVQNIHDTQPASSPVSDAYIATPYTVHGSTSMTTSTGSIFHPLTERPVSAAHLLSPVVVRRTNKIAELDQARRLAVVGSGVSSSSSASPLEPYEPHEIPPLPLTPTAATAQRASTAADPSMAPLVAVSTNAAADNRRLHPHDSHSVGLPDEPPPQYDTVV